MSYAACTLHTSHCLLLLLIEVALHAAFDAEVTILMAAFCSPKALRNRITPCFITLQEQPSPRIQHRDPGIFLVILPNFIEETVPFTPAAPDGTGH